MAELSENNLEVTENNLYDSYKLTQTEAWDRYKSNQTLR